MAGGETLPYGGGYVAPGGILFVNGTNDLSSNRVTLDVTNTVNVTNVFTPTNVFATTNIFSPSNGVAFTPTNVTNPGTNTVAGGGTNIFRPHTGPFPTTNQPQGTLVSENGQPVTNSFGTSTGTNFVNGTGRTPAADTGSGNTGGTGTTGGQTTGSGTSTTTTGGAANSGPWAPPGTVIIPQGSSGQAPGNSAQGALNQPNPPGALQLPSGTGPLPFPTPNPTPPPVRTPAGSAGSATRSGSTTR